MNRLNEKQFNYLNQMYRKIEIIFFYKVMGVSSAYNYLLIRLINLFSLIFLVRIIQLKEKLQKVSL